MTLYVLMGAMKAYVRENELKAMRTLRNDVRKDSTEAGKKALTGVDFS